MRSSVRTMAAIALGFVVGFLGAVISGQPIGRSLLGAAMLALTIGLIEAVLSWAIDSATEKGCSA